MRYYTIYNDGLLIAENQEALRRYYNTPIFELPEDYEEGKYIIGEVEEEIVNPETEETETVKVQKLVPNPNWDEEQYIRREQEFNKAFFQTSLGYIRRSVTMADGGKKDFLSDLMPVIKMGLEAGQVVNILTYDRPPFDHDIEDWTEYQHQVVVTPQFIQECFLQLSADFAPINNEEE